MTTKIIELVTQSPRWNSSARPNRYSLYRAPWRRLCQIMRKDHVQAAISIALLICLLIYMFLLGAIVGGK